MNKKYETPNIGDVFGKWTVINNIEIKEKGLRKVLCECSCNAKTQRYVGIISLCVGTSKCCGCDGIKKLKEVAITHNMSYDKFYSKWKSLKRRCEDKNDKAYKNYGERGINICDRWKDFNNFKEDLYTSYVEHIKLYGERNTTLDRMDNNKGYSLENCKWATMKEQGNNRRNNVIIEYEGEKYTLQELSEKLNINHDVIRTRLKRGWSLEEVIQNKEHYDRRSIMININGKDIPLKQYAESLGLNGDTVVCYVKRHNLTPEQSIERCLKNKK